MARGRMICNKICKDKAVNDLPDDTARLVFTWLITFADREGRTYGDPALVRSMVFPRRTDITVEQISVYLQAMHDLGLIIWYEVRGDWYIMFPAFEKNQLGIRKDHESESEIPPPPRRSKDVPTTSLGCNEVVPDTAQVKLSKVKLIEVNGEPPPASSFRMNFQPDYVRVWSAVTGMVAIPNDEVERVMDAINGLTLHHTREDDLIAFLRPFYDAWKVRKAKNGRTYSKLNAGWIDWALAGEIPEVGKPPRIDGKQYAEVYE